MCKDEAVVNEAIKGNNSILAKNMNFDEGQEDKYVLIDEVQELEMNVFVEAEQDQPKNQETEVPAEVIRIVEVVFSTLNLSKVGSNRKHKSVCYNNESVFGSSIEMSMTNWFSLRMYMLLTLMMMLMLSWTRPTQSRSIVTKFSRCLLVQFRLNL